MRMPGEFPGKSYRKERPVKPHVAPMIRDYELFLDQVVGVGYWGIVARIATRHGTTRPYAARLLDAAMAYVELVSISGGKEYVVPPEVDKALDLLVADTRGWRSICGAIGQRVFIDHWPTDGLCTDGRLKVGLTRRALAAKGLPVDAELWDSDEYHCGCAGSICP